MGTVSHFSLWPQRVQFREAGWAWARDHWRKQLANHVWGWVTESAYSLKQWGWDSRTQTPSAKPGLESTALQWWNTLPFVISWSTARPTPSGFNDISPQGQHWCFHGLLHMTDANVTGKCQIRETALLNHGWTLQPCTRSSRVNKGDARRFNLHSGHSEPSHSWGSGRGLKSQRAAPPLPSPWRTSPQRPLGGAPGLCRGCSSQKERFRNKAVPKVGGSPWQEMTAYMVAQGSERQSMSWAQSSASWS